MMCANPAIGSYSTTLSIQDQDGTIVSSTFGHDVADKNNTTLFCWWDATGGSNLNVGSYDFPYQGDLRLGLGSASTSSTFLGQMWIKTAGTYSLVGHTNLVDSNIRLDNTLRPVVICALRDSSFNRVAAALSFATGKFNSVNGGNASGMYLDIDIKDSVATTTNMQNFLIPDGQNEITLFDVTNTNIGVGTAGDDNDSLIFFSNGASASDSTYNHNIFFRKVTEINRPGAQNSYGITSAYGLKYFLFEDCYSVNSSAETDIYLKDSCQQGTVRYSRIVSANSNAYGAVAVGGQNQVPGGVTTAIEYVHTVAINPSAGGSGMRWCAAGLGGVIGTGYTSRCTFKGRWNVLNANTPGVYKSSSDIIYTSSTPPVDPANASVTVTGNTLQGNTAWFDPVTYKITSTYAAQRGLLGAEIFDS